MTFDDIARLVRRLERSDVTALTVSDATSSLTVRLAPGPAEPDRAAPASPPHAEPAPAVAALKAPAFGRLRLRHPEAAPDEPRFPRPVARGDIVAFLDIGSCLRPVVADRDGTLGTPLHADGSLVGYGTPLFPLL